MKTYLFALLFLTTTLSAQSTVGMQEQILSEEEEKTEAEVISELKCINESSYLPLFNSAWPNGPQYLREQLAMGANANKKYFIQLDVNHSVVYFKEGEHFFINVVGQPQDGPEIVQERMFVPVALNDCIRILPEACKWKGQREVKYIEICESGMDLSEGFKKDLFRVAVDSDSGSISPVDIVIAVRDCYQPNVYSIAYECFNKELFFDHQKALNYLEELKSYFISAGFDARVVPEKMAINYSKTDVKITFNGEEVDASKAE